MNATEHLHLERLALRAWPALDEADYDGWRLRAAQGYTGRANSVAPLAHGGLPVAEKVAHVEGWYAARQLPAKFRITESSVGKSEYHSSAEEYMYGLPHRDNGRQIDCQ